MGRGIVYCASCGSKILDRDFDSRAAFHLDGRGFCKSCAPNALKSLPPDRMADVLAQISQAESSARRKIPPPRPPAPTPAPRPRAVPASRMPLIAAATVAGLVVVILLVVMLSRSEPPPPPPTVVDRPAKVDREALAAQALQKAREYRDANPKELATQLASYQRLAEDYKGTRAAGEAQRDLEEIRRRQIQEAFDAELKVLQDQVRAATTKEEFDRVFRTLQEARSRHPDAEWSKGIDRLNQDALGQKKASDALPAPKRPLFNGKDTTGWYFTRGKWAAKDGMLEAVELDESQRTYIATTDEFGDFEIEGMIEATIRTYVEFNARGMDHMAQMHLEIGWHKFRVVAAGMDVKLFVDENPVPLSTGTTRRGQFGVFTLGAVRLKEIMIRP